MGKYLQPEKTKDTASVPIFQKVLETARGGHSLDASGLVAGQILKAGTPMTYDGTTRLAKKANVDGSDAKGLLYRDVVIGDNVPVAIVTRGTVYDKRIDAVPTAVKKALPLIIFDDSF
ncbi:hypothetical protein ACFFUE_07255 [Bergeyella porcorum]|uniref:hypothetical protein n=1 Tax=Bergeyella porcorum TaxID=1735111 RepID=UPI0035ED4263